MATVKKSLFGLSWGDSSKSNAQSDDVEAARKIATTPTAQEELDRLRADFESQLNTLQADYEARFEALPKQFEEWLDSYTAPKSKIKTSQPFDSSSKPDVPESLKRFRWMLNTLRKRMSNAKITKHLNAKHQRQHGFDLCSSTQIGNVIQSPLQLKRSEQKYHLSMSKSRVERALPLAWDLLTPHEKRLFEAEFPTAEIKQSSATNTPLLSSRPPKPEITGDYKLMNWISRHLIKRFTSVEIANHISDFTKRHGGFGISSQTVRSFYKGVYVWNTSACAWYPPLRQDKLPLVIKAAYQLLTPAEQAEYNEMLGALK